jgi:hypothetical protein
MLKVDPWGVWVGHHHNLYFYHSLFGLSRNGMNNVLITADHSPPSILNLFAKSFQDGIPSAANCFRMIARLPAADPEEHTCKSDLM